MPNPNVYWSGSGSVGTTGNYFQCANYAQSVYWAFDQAYAAPDIGGQTVATYNNFDVAWSHGFRNGWGTKLTGYYRRGYNTYQTVLLNAGPPDPVTGQQTAGRSKSGKPERLRRMESSSCSRLRIARRAGAGFDDELRQRAHDDAAGFQLGQHPGRRASISTKRVRSSTPRICPRSPRSREFSTRRRAD